MNYEVSFIYMYSECTSCIIFDNDDTEIFRDDDGNLDPSFMEELVSEIGARNGRDYEIRLNRLGYIDFIKYRIDWETYERALTRALSLMRESLGRDSYYRDVLGLI